MREYTGRFASGCAVRVFAITLLMGAVAYGEVDLTPVESSYELDGVTLTNVLFHDGRQEIRYDPPKDWRLSGSGSRLTLVSNAFANADGHVEVKSLAEMLPFDEANIKKYVESARLSLPRDARSIETLGTRLNPLKICGHDTLAVELQYEMLGASYRTQLLYLNRERQQWIFRITAPSKTFDQAFEPFRASLYSLTGL
jgi:hypothetical protein